MSCEVIGTSDVGVLSYGEYRNTLLNMLCVSSIPMVVDIDTGFGGRSRFCVPSGNMSRWESRGS